MRSSSMLVSLPSSWRNNAYAYESLVDSGEWEQGAPTSRRRRRPHRRKQGTVCQESVDGRPRSASVVHSTTNVVQTSSPSEPWNHRDELDLFAHRKPPKEQTDNHQFQILAAWPDHASDEDSTEEGMIYATKYYHRCAILSKPKRLDSSASSFDTLETQTEEETSTFSSFDGEGSKSVRWPLDGGLETVHTYEIPDTHTVRIVILLLLNKGTDCPPEENFEFLHCEYQTQDRLKVTGVLQQISRLIHAEDQPFTRLFHQGLEMINAIAIQDFDLDDGRSILVATRNGEQPIPVVLEQAHVLLGDKMLLAELRKARIAGRSLQTLCSSFRQETIDPKVDTLSPNPSMELAAVGSFRDVTSGEII